MKYNINIIKSNRKTFSLEIKPDLSIVCRVPLSAGEDEINGFMENNEARLEGYIEKLKKSLPKETTPLSEEEIKLLKKRAKRYISARAQYWAELMSVKYGKISVRAQKTRWGSCSSGGNLSFNCLLMLTDEAVTDYVIVHELCHLKEMNHSKRFWALVESVLPDYELRRKELKKYESVLIGRLG